MSGGAAERAPTADPPPPTRGPLGVLTRVVGAVNRFVLVLGMVALLAAAGILSAAVFLRYYLHQPTDWQDEMAVFLLAGTTFLCSGYVQERRAHIGIEALAGLLPEGVNVVRRHFVDLASLVFCAFFTWKTLALFLEAYYEGQTTSSAWAPPLAIPYGLMASGMLLLSAQLLLQVLVGLLGARGRAARTAPRIRQ
jgi:TRAP-type C4-dicarboxylate transport system permease small subunit